MLEWLQEHVAIVKEMQSQSQLLLVHQNWKGRMDVHEWELDLSWLQSGTVNAWRAVPEDAPNHTLAARAMQQDLRRVKRDYQARRIQQGPTVGDRVHTGKNGQGTVRYLGIIEGTSGAWAGVELDSPNGKNDGTAKGRRYFQCRQKYGTFVRPQTLRLA